jgi:L,D-peptidoglycan transpeptidase YkuD (ErfK/YbiS/YcfS/YnhG family)
MDVWQRGPQGWQPVDGGIGIPTHVGSAGLAPKAKDTIPATPMGVYSLDFAFGTQPSPGGGLRGWRGRRDLRGRERGECRNQRARHRNQRRSKEKETALHASSVRAAPIRHAMPYATRTSSGVSR